MGWGCFAGGGVCVMALALTGCAIGSQRVPRLGGQSAQMRNGNSRVMG